MFKVSNVKNIWNVITVFTKQHAPEILVGLGITGMTAGTILAIKATPEAAQKIEDAIEDANEILLDQAVAKQMDVYSPIKKLPASEVFKLCWRDYAPAVATSVAGAVCIVGGTHINLRRNAALVTACKLSEMTIKDLQEYKNKVIETIGEEKNTEIEDELDQKHIDEVTSSINMDSIAISGHGPILYFEKMGGQWFRSDKETIREAINRLNFTMTDDRYVSLNDFYDELGLHHTVAGRDLGWNIDYGLIEPKFSSQLMANGVPVVVVNTHIEPRVNFGSLY